jgi:hypothetical protein
MESHYVGVRVSKATYAALVARQNESEVPVSLAALVRHLLDQSLGVKKKNGRRR